MRTNAVREPAVEDIHSIVKLDVQIFGRVWGDDDYIREFARGEWNVRVIGPRSDVQAALWYRFRKDGSVEMEQVCVSKQWRSQGLGTRLIKYLIRMDIPIWAWVRKDNPRALELYKRLGFRVLRLSKTRFDCGGGHRIRRDA